MWAGVVMLALVGAGGAVHDRLSAAGVLAGEDEQGAQQHAGVSRAESEPGEDPPLLEVAEAVPGWGTGGGQGLVRVSLGGLAPQWCGVAPPKRRSSVQSPPSDCTEAHLPFREALRMFRGHPGASLAKRFTTEFPAWCWTLPEAVA